MKKNEVIEEVATVKFKGFILASDAIKIKVLKEKHVEQLPKIVQPKRLVEEEFSVLGYIKAFASVLIRFRLSEQLALVHLTDYVIFMRPGSKDDQDALYKEVTTQYVQLFVE